MSAWILAATVVAWGQSPVEIPKADLPKSAPCAVGVATGDHTKERKPVAGLVYEGKSFYFCNRSELERFRANPAAYLPPVLPRPMPKFDLVSLDGKRWGAEAFGKRVVLVDFWATWCGPCREMKPILEEVREKHKASGFEVLSVSIDEKRADLDRFLKKTKFGNPVFHDSGTTWADWNVVAVPATFLIVDGRVVQQWVGRVKRETIDAAVVEGLAKLG